MRWSIIRLIFFRELRDQLRDRRTIFMIAVLPILIYPILGTAMLQFAGMADKPSVVGVSGSSYLPPVLATSAGVNPLPATAWFTFTPSALATPASACERALSAMILSEVARRQQGYPPLLIAGRFPMAYSDSALEARNLEVAFVDSDARAALEGKQVDAVLAVPPDFEARIESDGRPMLEISYRDKEEHSRLAARRLSGVLSKWKHQLREVRMLRHGLPPDFDDVFEVRDMGKPKNTDDAAAEGMLDLLMRIFPFMLVMWSLAGALYPAVDLCAGEKERGTMETLLISPASRQEIVWGKFLTIWLFSAATALLNLASMGVTASSFSGFLGHDMLRPVAIFWCVLLALPLSAFFSALCLAVGAYARSSKEGQYYLMPLFVITMPLIFLTLAPGVELNPFYSLVPVTGVALLMQRLMTVSLDQVPWLYFVPVLAPIVLYSGLALHWAIEQFKREEVLFREAERLEIRLWLRRLLREKEPLPSAGQAFFCFALVLMLRWLALSWSSQTSLLESTAVAYLAFVAAPPLLMALVLTTRPRQGLGLTLPSPRALLAAAVLAVLLLPPLAKLTLTILRQFPVITELLSQRQPLVKELGTLGAEAETAAWWQPLLVFGLLPAVLEELAFRGFILSGLRRRLPLWSAILLSSFLFALYHMNVFQVLPAFILGIVLGLLAAWSGSVLPGMLFHLLYNGVLLGVALLPRFGYSDENVPLQVLFHPAVTAIFTLLALGFLLFLGRRITAPANENQTRLQVPHCVPSPEPAADPTP
jgi:sodium transport system permease protein